MEYFVSIASMYTLCYVDISDSGIFSISCMRILYYVDIIGSSEFFQSRLQCKCARALFLLILCSRKCEVIFTRFHAFMWWRKKQVC